MSQPIQFSSKIQLLYSGFAPNAPQTVMAFDDFMHPANTGVNDEDTFISVLNEQL